MEIHEVASKCLFEIIHTASQFLTFSSMNYLKDKKLMLFQEKSWFYLKFDSQCIERGLKELGSSTHQEG